MTMREHDTHTTQMDPVATDIGSGAPPEYAGRDVDVRDEHDVRDPRRFDERDRDRDRDRDRRDDWYEPRYDDRRRMRRYEDDGPDFAEQAARFARRHLRTPETKEFFRTSEFALAVVGALMLMLAAAVHETFDAEEMWPLVTALFGLYILSRGIAKAGVRQDDGRR